MIIAFNLLLRSLEPAESACSRIHVSWVGYVQRVDLQYRSGVGDGAPEAQSNCFPLCATFKQEQFDLSSRRSGVTQ